MPLILGIDPGSNITGYGLIDWSDHRFRYVSSGCIRLSGMGVPDKLRTIQESLDELIRVYSPTVGSIEQVFVQHNASSALKLGQARGAAIATMACHRLEVHEYSAKQVKKAVVGYGGADKAQVQHMVQHILQLNGLPQVDAADALAIALCHTYSHQGLDRVGARKMRRRRVR